MVTAALKGSILQHLVIIVYSVDYQGGLLYTSNDPPGEIVVPVKMPVTRDKTERPHGALL